MKKQNNKSHILFRFGCIILIFLVISAFIVSKLFYTTVIEAHAWNERSRKHMDRLDTIAPERGNILADDGSILACNYTVYDVLFDFRHYKVKRDMDWKTLDALADSLDAHFPRRAGLAQMPPDSVKKYSWHAYLRRKLEVNPENLPRALRLARNVSLEDFERIGGFPFIKEFYEGSNLKKKSSPYYKTAVTRRQLPYGSMAKYSIGKVYQDQGNKQWHGYSGLEKDLDSLLYGEPGLAKPVTLTRGMGQWITKEPVRGADVITTIDIDIQDMLEEELLATLQRVGAEWGTAMIMEVGTGQIKAISNLELLESGEYGEAYNRFVEPYEPGSVVKTLSLMLAFEDGLIRSVNESVDCSPFQGTSDPHAPTVKNIKQVLGMSSNTGVSRIIFRGYRDRPEAYWDRLASIGFFEKMHTGIAEEKLPRIPKLLDHDKKGNRITMTARLLSLARQTFGYNTEIPPLYTLSIYNAIAGGGRYVRPSLVKGIRRADGTDSIFPVSYIRDRICSEETAAKMRECLHEVVWGKGCTGRAVQDDRVEIAGKTGTAFPVRVGVGGYDTSRRRYAFAGFFPYDKPMYSCMVVILAPAHSTSAASGSGGVLRDVAVKMHARGMLGNHNYYTHTSSGSLPEAARGTDAAAVRKMTSSQKVALRNAPGKVSPGRVPDVTGYNIAAATRILEKAGLNVTVSGRGHVVSQSPAAGARLVKGNKILLILK